MKKTLLFITVGAVVVVLGIASVSAFESWVVNVTAHIENALKITPANGELIFGTVFPQEHLEKRIWVTTSKSFCAGNQRRVLNIDYKIVQKPKPVWPEPQNCQEDFEDIDEARAYCHDNPGNLNCCYPSICPYLSKLPVYQDPEPYTDYGVASFHDPDDPGSIATGTINKDTDLLDEWIIDLDVPCFEGMCAQDWTHPGYELPIELESQDFGCDLWIEVTKIY